MNNRLSSPRGAIKNRYEVVVVGSGYGGGIAASRMARAGRHVCVLERGKEFQPGEYPDTIHEAVPEMQIDTPKSHIGSRDGLYDMRVNNEMNAFIGCGLGGTSLLNANVSLRAEPRVLEDPSWPAELRDDLDNGLEAGYQRAEEMLRPKPYPTTFPPLPKTNALQSSAGYLGERFYRTPINVTFEDGTNHVGVYQRACKLCGDCVSGCNYGAKNTTLMNYLPDAVNFGAEIFTQISVRYLERKEDHWLVHYQVLESGQEDFDAPTQYIMTDLVILGAGTLGSTEILLRSRERGLALSNQLGHKFSGNGDILGFAYNADEAIESIGFGHRPVEGGDPVGPCITGIIDIREQEELDNGMVIEEGSIPGALASIMPLGMMTAARLFGKDTDSGFADFVQEKQRELESLLLGSCEGAMENTLVFLVMSHDDAGGRMVLEDDRLRIKWPGVGKQSIVGRINRKLEAATRALGGTYVKNPVWSKILGHDLITVHPLGGCPMGESAESGVVNHKGQVFNGERGDEVYQNLYVSDGAVVPRSLGVNPLLTISALAERCCALIAAENNWTVNYDLPSKPRKPQRVEKLGLQFTERMTGAFSTEILDDFQRAAEEGVREGTHFEFTLTMIADDLEKMLEDENYPARLIGSVKAPQLSHDALTVTDGVFKLFQHDPEAVGTRRMSYQMRLTSEEGDRFYFDGYKRVHNDSGIDIWSDTTTLFFDLYQGESAAGARIGRGILKIRRSDFVRQMGTIRVLHAKDLQQRLSAKARFGAHFAGVLMDTYGGIFAKRNIFDPDAPLRKRRPLRVEPPEVHFALTSDNVEIQLTRYQGGPKGPVMLSHGLGVSSLIFSIDTIETNLLEFLCARGYDVWLLDYRTSIDRPTAGDRASADLIAEHDVPTAVETIRKLTGAPDIQVVAHCFGSTTFTMSMLLGLKGVRSAVCSQISTHVKVPASTWIKSGLHLPQVLDALGVDSLTAYVNKYANWKARLLDLALKLYPIEAEEHCKSPVCHRITFLYSNLYEHDQLNRATHDALHELFGVANIEAFEQLALMARHGHMVTAQGEDAYLPHLDRLAIPIAFIHGGENECFLPESTELTYQHLRECNGKGLYSRHVIPNYGHIDCIFGKNAARDIYPLIADHLDKTL